MYVGQSIDMIGYIC